MIKSVKLYEYLRKTVSVVAPNRCPFCGDVIEAEKYYCPRCFEHLPFVEKELSPPENISRLIACCYYRHRARKAVLQLKYGCLVYPADAFALMISEKLAGVSADLIVPIPSSRASIRKRGFATAELIGKTVSMRTGLPMVKALGANRNKKEQKGLSARNRLINAQSAFFIKSGFDLSGKTVVLLDDVCTTGATLSAAAKLLLDAGAKEVIAAVFAKTMSCGNIEITRKKYRLRG